MLMVCWRHRASLSVLYLLSTPMIITNSINNSIIIIIWALQLYPGTSTSSAPVRPWCPSWSRPSVVRSTTAGCRPTLSRPRSTGSAPPRQPCRLPSAPHWSGSGCPETTVRRPTQRCSWWTTWRRAPPTVVLTGTCRRVLTSTGQWA